MLKVVPSYNGKTIAAEFLAVNEQIHNALASVDEKLLKEKGRMGS
jgi:hypothetical protein